MRVLSHRGNLRGPRSVDENSLTALRAAVRDGFAVEFDINLDPERNRLVLGHDSAPWHQDREPSAFLRDDGVPGGHALNVKHLCSLPAILAQLEAAGAYSRFFLFDFELLEPDLGACRFLMRSLQERGLRVAYRISDREPFLELYRDDRHVDHVWVDEFDHAWFGAEHAKVLHDAGKKVSYVSPELHRPLPADRLKARWEEVVRWGVSGICTDFARDLRATVGGAG